MYTMDFLSEINNLILSYLSTGVKNSRINECTNLQL